ncbi:MAG: flagellar biosynthesis protein [Roseovarius sp.]
MSVSHLLEDFGAANPSNVVEMTDVLLEEERLEAFEKGYQAGWDDSAKAQEDDSDRASSEFAQALADISFSYEEAYTSLLDGVRPVIVQVVETVLPAAARDALAPLLAEIIMQEVSLHGRRSVVISVAQGAATAVPRDSLDTLPVPVTIREDPMLAPDQVQLGFDDSAEQEIDLTATIRQITAAIETYFTNGHVEDERKSA